VTNNPGGAALVAALPFWAAGTHLIKVKASVALWTDDVVMITKVEFNES
jgi:hypothetical protein